MSRRDRGYKRDFVTIEMGGLRLEHQCPEHVKASPNIFDGPHVDPEPESQVVPLVYAVDHYDDGEARTNEAPIF